MHRRQRQDRGGTGKYSQTVPPPARKTDYGVPQALGYDGKTAHTDDFS